MKKFAISILGALFLAGILLTATTTSLGQQKAPAGPREYEWLQQFVGGWDSNAELFLEPGKPPLTWKGPETARKVGQFWVVAESTVTFMDQEMTGIRTFGYDSLKKKYVSASVGTFSSHLWNYEGTVNATGKVLTMVADGPAPYAPGTLCKWRDVFEFKSDDHRVLTNSVQLKDGTWTPVVKVESRRRKP
jgi:hypothetical protein